MTRAEIHSRIRYYALGCFAFTLPVARLMQLFIIILILNWLIEGNFKEKFRKLFSSRLALLFIGFYILHLAGLLYTTDMGEGGFDVQVKLSMLLFPLVLATSSFAPGSRDFVFKAFIAGGIAAALIMLSNASYIYLHTGENNFTYEKFSFFIHPSYFSMYLNFAIAYLLLQLDMGRIRTRKDTAIAISVILFFSMIIALLSSKLGLLTMLLIFALYIVHLVLRRRMYMVGAAAVVFLLLSFAAVKIFAPTVIERIRIAVNAFENPAPDARDAESTAVRLLVWKAAGQVISEHPLLGTGTGDARTELMKEYEKRGMTGAIINKLNTHNEFYQVAVTLGITGLIYFLVMMFWPFIWAFRRKFWLYVFFISILLLNFLTESMFETQAGVLFYSFFNSFLLFDFISEAAISKTGK